MWSSVMISNLVMLLVYLSCQVLGMTPKIMLLVIVVPSKGSFVLIFWHEQCACVMQSDYLHVVRISYWDCIRNKSSILIWNSVIGMGRNNRVILGIRPKVVAKTLMI